MSFPSAPPSTKYIGIYVKTAFVDSRSRFGHELFAASFTRIEVHLGDQNVEGMITLPFPGFLSGQSPFRGFLSLHSKKYDKLLVSHAKLMLITNFIIINKIRLLNLLLLTPFIADFIKAFIPELHKSLHA